MHENKNVQSLSAKERIGVGLGAAAIGVLVAGGVSSAHEIGSSDTSYASELPPHDQAALPITVHLEPTTSNANTEHTVSQTPSFKGKITIKKKIENTTNQNVISSNVITSVNTLSSVSPQGASVNKSILGTANQELMSLNLEKLTIPDEVKKIMDENATFMWPIGCSGFLVKDINGTPIGDVTANHCLPRQDKQIIGSDGNLYLPEIAPLHVYTGSSYNNLSQVGVIDKFLVPPTIINKDTAAGALNKDIVIGAFKGQSIDKVIQAYRHTKLKESEIATQLNKGDVVYVSGWPQFQPNNTGPQRRQDFAMQVVAKGSVTDTNGDTFNSVWAAVAQDADGADCSPGLSGSQAFTYKDGQYHSIGVVSTGANLLPTLGQTQDQANNKRQYYENLLGVDLSQAGSICTFSYKMTTRTGGASVAEVSTTYENIPGYVNALIKNSHNEFFDPNYVKTWVRGATNLDPNGKGHWIMNPVIFYDKVSGGAVLASYTDNTKDALELDFVPDFKDQKFNGYPELNNVSGEISTFNGLGGSNGFASKNGGLIFAQHLENQSAIEYVQKDPAFSLYYDDATQSLQIMQYKHN